MMENRYRIGFAFGVFLIVTGLLLTLKGDSLVTHWSSGSSVWNTHYDHSTGRAYEAAGFIMLTVGFVTNLLLWVKLLPEHRTESHQND
jgi:hypothetical protein